MTARMGLAKNSDVVDPQRRHNGEKRDSLGPAHHRKVRFPLPPRNAHVEEGHGDDEFCGAPPDNEEIAPIPRQDGVDYSENVIRSRWSHLSIGRGSELRRSFPLLVAN
jgi:hypothetical protein